MFTHQTPPTISYREDYLSVLPDALALESCAVVRPTTPTDSAVSAVLPKLALLEQLRPRVLRLPEFDMRQYDQLGPRARALAFAESQCRVAPTSWEEVLQQFARLAAEERTLVAECALLVVKGCIPEEAVHSFKSSRSRLQVAAHTRKLVSYLLANYPVVAPHTHATPESLAAVLQLADDVHLGLMRHPRRAPGSARGPRELRYRIFTLLVRSHNAVDSAVSFLFRNQKHRIKEHVPQMFASHRKRGSREEE